MHFEWCARIERHISLRRVLFVGEGDESGRIVGPNPRAPRFRTRVAILAVCQGSSKDSADDAREGRRHEELVDF